jgi:hypothetical protein
MNLRTSISVLTAAALSAGVLAAATTSASSAAGEDGATTLTFALASRRVSETHVDVGRKGPTLGDRYLTGVSLKSAGKIAGRLEIDCVALDRVYEGQMCTLVAILADGTLTFQSAGVSAPIPNVGTPAEAYAVTGGTGSFAGATGEMSVGEGDHGPATITLLP